MATAINKVQCVKCGKETGTLKCAGCLEDFCDDHLTDHRQELIQQLNQIEINQDLFRQTLTEHTTNPQRESLINEINQWEQDSINKIQQTAAKCRQFVIEYTNKHIQQMEINLTKFTTQLKEIRQKNDFNEIDLKKFSEQLTQLQQKQQHHRPSNISIQQDPTSLIKKISVVISFGKSYSSINIHNNTKWKQDGLTVAGGNGDGNQLDQLSSPFGIYVDDDQTIYIANFESNRIVQWGYGAKNGEVVTSGNGEENRMDELNSPADVIVDKKDDSLIICDARNKRVVRWSRRNNINPQTIISNIHCYGLTMDNNGDLYVSDSERHEVRRWVKGDTIGTIVAGGNREGDKLNQLSLPTSIFVDEDYSLYVSDTLNHRVMKWMKGEKEGIVVAGGNGEGNSLIQLSHPDGVIVDHLGNVYVADTENHRIMRWSVGTREGSIILGGNGEGKQANQFKGPAALSFDRQGNLYVADHNNNRIQKFDIDAD